MPTKKKTKLHSLIQEADYSYYKYSDLCEALTESDYTSLAIGDYIRLKRTNYPNKVVLLRHDVDRLPSLALKFAALEHAFGIRATYYFRTHPASFNAPIIKEISNLGHEIGYHYETLSDTKGDKELAAELFAKNIQKLRNLVPIETAAMHGRPLSRWDNRLIWELKSLEEFDLIGEVYQSLDYKIIDYFSDTGRTWHPFRYNVRDLTNQESRIILETTDDLIAHIRTGRSGQLCILTHPERWPQHTAHWLIQSCADITVNLIKSILSK